MSTEGTAVPIARVTSEIATLIEDCARTGHCTLDGQTYSSAQLLMASLPRDKAIELPPDPTAAIKALDTMIDRAKATVVMPPSGNVFEQIGKGIAGLFQPAAEDQTDSNNNLRVNVTTLNVMNKLEGGILTVYNTWEDLDRYQGFHFLADDYAKAPRGLQTYYPAPLVAEVEGTNIYGISGLIDGHKKEAGTDNYGVGSWRFSSEKATGMGQLGNYGYLMFALPGDNSPAIAFSLFHGYLSVSRLLSISMKLDVSSITDVTEGEPFGADKFKSFASTTLSRQNPDRRENWITSATISTHGVKVTASVATWHGSDPKKTSYMDVDVRNAVVTLVFEPDS